MPDDLYKSELETYRDYRSTFLASGNGQRVLADLIQAFFYNQITLPATEMDMARAEAALRRSLARIRVAEKRRKKPGAINR